MKRIVLLVTTTAFVATLLALGAGMAFAQTSSNTVCETTGEKNNKITTCVTTTTTKETTTETTNLPDEFVVTNLPDEFVVTNLPNKSVSTPATGPCEVGNSDRVGTAEGISTQEFAVISTQTLKVISTQTLKVTSTQTFETTTVTVKTEVFEGPNNNPQKLISSTTTPPVVTKTPQGAPVVTRTPSGDPIVTKTPQGAPVVTETPIGDPVFTATGKCNNVAGPQNEKAVENANPRALEPRPRGNQPLNETPQGSELGDASLPVG